MHMIRLPINGLTFTGDSGTTGVKNWETKFLLPEIAIFRPKQMLMAFK